MQEDSRKHGIDIHSITDKCEATITFPNGLPRQLNLFKKKGVIKKEELIAEIKRLRSK
jgi:hypothetical protein